MELSIVWLSYFFKFFVIFGGLFLEVGKKDWVYRLIIKIRLKFEVNICLVFCYMVLV